MVDTSWVLGAGTGLGWASASGLSWRQSHPKALKAIGLRPLSSVPRGHLRRAAHNTREAGSMGVDKQAGARQKARPLPLELPPLAPVIAAHQDLGFTPGPKLGDAGELESREAELRRCDALYKEQLGRLERQRGPVLVPVSPNQILKPCLCARHFPAAQPAGASALLALLPGLAIRPMAPVPCREHRAEVTFVPFPEITCTGALG
ncbi:hypothetical protein J1605_006415 [Eschrichtius robustus]|uniref:Uncharacterized protein n=1 Tax=Eschrichtius robustus TaxID=9764 RepID=A0AB34H681_ESCRO|nr:hypothetical protein J1605_006415 [Eschrichtius robustus]